MESVEAKLSDFKMHEVPHLHGSLLDHCRGVYTLLKAWDESETVCNAGLCHSIYGTEYFTHKTLPLAQRQKVVDAIGLASERLAYLFCAMERASLFRNLERRTAFQVKNRLTGNAEPLSESDVRALYAIALANDIDQRAKDPNQMKVPHAGIYLQSGRFLSKTAFLDYWSIYGANT